eukprot:15460811-Alexandrium_andersonii.AAC.1
MSVEYPAGRVIASSQFDKQWFVFTFKVRGTFTLKNTQINAAGYVDELRSRWNMCYKLVAEVVEPT